MERVNQSTLQCCFIHEILGYFSRKLKYETPWCVIWNMRSPKSFRIWIEYLNPTVTKFMKGRYVMIIITDFVSSCYIEKSYKTFLLWLTTNIYQWKKMTHTITTFYNNCMLLHRICKILPFRSFLYKQGHFQATLALVAGNKGAIKLFIGLSSKQILQHNNPVLLHCHTWPNT